MKAIKRHPDEPCLRCFTYCESQAGCDRLIHRLYGMQPADLLVDLVWAHPTWFVV